MMKFVDGFGNIEVGQTVYVTNGQSGPNFQIRAHKVEKIGRQFVHLDGRTVFSYDGLEKTQYTKGNIYSSMAAYELIKMRNSKVEEVSIRIRKVRISYEQAIAIEKILDWK